MSVLKLKNFTFYSHYGIFHEMYICIKIKKGIEI